MDSKFIKEIFTLTNKIAGRRACLKIKAVSRGYLYVEMRELEEAVKYHSLVQVIFWDLATKKDEVFEDLSLKDIMETYPFIRDCVKSTYPEYLI